MAERQRRRAQVTGVVQGVRFRPHVHRLATGLRLAGHVANGDRGVTVEVEGQTAALDDFARRLVEDAPAMARIDTVRWAPLPVTGADGFAIQASTGGGGGVTGVPADLGPCDDCLREMADPADRRHGYPLLNCTACGPRFTVVTGLPYDRARTALSDFPMCDDCQAEYDDPRDRRFHAQPTACPACGPRLWWASPDGAVDGDEDPVQRAQSVIAAGGIVGVLGVGGVHLACRADLDQTVLELRRRKRRPDRPLAVMVADLQTAGLVADVGDAERQLLRGPDRPILLVPATGRGLSEHVAPRLGCVGVMLPPSPLHVALIPAGQAWIMTSGNLAGEPICTDPAEAVQRLGVIVDGLLLHDRPVVQPCDDSVVSVMRDPAGEPVTVPVRRSRGHAPMPVAVRLPRSPPILAVGGDLKATFALRHGDQVICSQHLGDHDDLATTTAFGAAVDHLCGLLGITPQVIAHDLHPGYRSTAWATAHAGGRPLVPVQHHHAHVASLLAEHRRPGPIIGFSFDGTGYGADGTIWGGEVLLADLGSATRIGHLRPAPLPGGDAAVRRPDRQAIARLLDAGITPDAALPPWVALTPVERQVLCQQVDRDIATTPTSSMGRLFDAVSALAGVCQQVTYEGQAAMELEAVSGQDGDAYPLPIDADGVWDPEPLLRALVADVRAGRHAAHMGTRFHASVVAAITAGARAARRTHGVNVVGLTGGVFQNRLLLEGAWRALIADGFDVLVHRVVPPGDGGLSLGQAAVAAARMGSA